MYREHCDLQKHTHLLYIKTNKTNNNRIVTVKEEQYVLEIANHKNNSNNSNHLNNQTVNYNNPKKRDYADQSNSTIRGIQTTGYAVASMAGFLLCVFYFIFIFCEYAKYSQLKKTKQKKNDARYFLFLDFFYLFLRHTYIHKQKHKKKKKHKQHFIKYV